MPRTWARRPCHGRFALALLAGVPANAGDYRSSRAGLPCHERGAGLALAEARWWVGIAPHPGPLPRGERERGCTEKRKTKNEKCKMLGGPRPCPSPEYQGRGWIVNAMSNDKHAMTNGKW